MSPASIVFAIVLALAPDPGDDNPLGFEDAGALAEFNAGMEAWHADDYPTAQRLLESAYAAEPRPELLYSLGQLARLQGDCEEATLRFEAFLRTEPSAKQAAQARVNLERCAAELPPEPEPEPPPPEVGPEPAPEVVDPSPSPPEQPRGPDALGISLTVVGSAATAVGLGVFGSSFAAQRRAEQEFDVARFDDGIARARTQYFTGIGLASVGAAVLVVGVVRLLLVKRRKRARQTAAWRYSPWPHASPPARPVRSGRLQHI